MACGKSKNGTKLFITDLNRRVTVFNEHGLRESTWRDGAEILESQMLRLGTHSESLCVFQNLSYFSVFDFRGEYRNEIRLRPKWLLQGVDTPEFCFCQNSIVIADGYSLTQYHMRGKMTGQFQKFLGLSEECFSDEIPLALRQSYARFGAGSLWALLRAHVSQDNRHFHLPSWRAGAGSRSFALCSSPSQLYFLDPQGILHVFLEDLEEVGQIDLSMDVLHTRHMCLAGENLNFLVVSESYRNCLLIYDIENVAKCELILEVRVSDLGADGCVAYDNFALFVTSFDELIALSCFC
jgi:hypothetical protein